MRPSAEQFGKRRANATRERLSALAGLRVQPWLAFMLFLALFSGFNLALAGVHEEKPAALVIGVVPYNSPRAIATGYEPLRQFLQRVLQREVRLFTAPSFDEFVNRALQGRYDIALAAGHEARLLQADAGWLPLVTYQAAFDVLLVKDRDRSEIGGFRDLDGRRLGSLGEGSLTSLWLAQQLKEHAVAPSELIFINGADSLAKQVLSGRFDGAAFTRLGFNQLSAAERAGLSVFLQSRMFLGRTYLLSPKRSAEYALIRAGLDEFAESEAGKAYFQRAQLGGYREVLPAELELMEPYAQDLRIRMTTPPRAEGANQEGKGHVAK